MASIQWNYNATDDIVKVEIWDVVDKGKKRESLSNTLVNGKDKLKMHNNTVNSEENSATAHVPPSLDAEFVDVYKGTNGVIFLFDMTKAWTFEYIEREIRHCPPHLPILILANHRDMGHHRVITSDQVQGFIDTILGEDGEQGRTRTGQIRHSEASMRNGFGLRYLYKFFNLPYLHLQRETLLKQLERNLDEIEGSCQELDGILESDEHNYDIFLETITNRRRMMAEQLSSVPKTSTDTIPVPPRSASMPANMASAGEEQQPALVKPTPSIIIGANNPLPSRFQQQIKTSNGVQKNNSTLSNSSELRKANTSAVKNIEDFIPDEMEHSSFRKFLDEPSLPPEDGLPIVEEDSEDETSQSNNNPMVAKYQEEIDPEDFEELQSTTTAIPNKIENVGEEDLSRAEEELEDNQNITNVTKVIVEESEDTKRNSPTLNCDDIDALENLYISTNTGDVPNGHNLLSCYNNGVSEASSECSSVKSEKTRGKSKTKITPTSVKKKKKPTKSPHNGPLATDDDSLRNGGIDTAAGGGGVGGVPKKKSSTKALKTRNRTTNKGNKSEEEILEEERRQLEAFLGSGGDDEGFKLNRDQNAYEMF